MHNVQTYLEETGILQAPFFRYKIDVHPNLWNYQNVLIELVGKMDLKDFEFTNTQLD